MPQQSRTILKDPSCRLAVPAIVNGIEICAKRAPSPFPLPSREGSCKTLSPGGRGKGEGGFQLHSKALISTQFSVAIRVAGPVLSRNSLDRGFTS